MGFKIAWELPPKVTSTWHKPFFLHKVCDSYKRKETQETKRTGVICCLIKGPVLHSFNKLQWVFCSTKGTVTLLCTIESLPHRRAVPEKKNTSILVTLRGHLEPGQGPPDDDFWLAESYSLVTSRLTAERVEAPGKLAISVNLNVTCMCPVNYISQHFLN